MIFDKGENRLNNGINFAETDNRQFNIIIDADNDQVNEQFNLFRDSTQFLSVNPAFRFSLAGQNSWFNGGGNVGIGTESPSKELSVIGTIRSAYDSTEVEFVEFKHGGNNGIINTVGDGKLIFQHDGNNKMTIVDDGKVGIGVFDPIEQLDVNGAIKIGNTTNPTPQAGTIKWNNTATKFEGYDGSQWQSLSSLEDADGDTKVIVENTPDDDIIRFTTGGSTIWSIKNHQLRSSNQNIAIGSSSLNTLTTGFNNVAVGNSSLRSLTTGYGNIALGLSTLYHTVDKIGLVAVGDSALYMNGSDNPTSSQAKENTAVGYKSMMQNVIGSKNTAVGFEALKSNISGVENATLGYASLIANTTGSNNTAIGHYSLPQNITGGGNTSVGSNAMQNRVDGSSNTAVGYNAMIFLDSGDFNTALGRSANSSSVPKSNSTGIGYDAQPNSSNAVRIGNATVSNIGGYAAWTNLSDGRVKTNVQENIIGLDFINKLRPVSYHLDMDAIASLIQTPEELRLTEAESLKAAEVQNGFIAQEVESAAQEVGFDFHGVYRPVNDMDHYGLRYAEFVVPLVKAVQELSATNNELFRMIEALQNENKVIKEALGRLEKGK